MGFKIGRAFEKSFQKVFNTFEQNFDVRDTDRLLANILTGGLAGAGEAVVETAGVFGSEAAKALSKPEEAGAVLDVNSPTAEQVEEQNRKKLQESLFKNTPGVRSQTVLTPR